MIKMDKDLYDAFEFASLVYKGIGAGHYYLNGVPLCLYGYGEEIGYVENKLYGITGISLRASDDAVKAVNARLGKAAFGRITWRQYTEQLNIIRKG